MKYAVQRVVAGFATMLLVSLLAFVAFDLISGDPAEIMLGTQATAEGLAALRTELGLDRPLPVRYLDWLGGFFTGDLGVSYQYKQAVWDLIAPKVAVTLCLSLLSFLLVVGVSLPLGVFAGEKGEGKLEWLWTALGQFCMAAPPFFTGILLSWGFGVALKWFTAGSFPGLKENLGGSLQYLFFAAVALAIPRTAMTVRMLRSTVAGEWGKDYVRTAVARGNDRAQVLRRHVLKNALPTVVAFLAQTMAELAAGAVVVEQVFAIPGLGRLLVASIANRDYPVVQAIVVILAFWVVLSGVAADLIQQWLDPRLRLGGGA